MKITVQGMTLENLGFRYHKPYWKIFDDIKSGKVNEISTIRWLLQKDLFFLFYFILGENKDNYAKMNHKFIIDACNEIQDGPASNTLDVWAREHLKSSIITISETIQYTLNYPESTTCIFSFKASIAKVFLSEIKSIYERSSLLQTCFPELVGNIEKEAQGWSLDNGLILKRKGSKREPTVYAAGLVEGMPTGMHFDRMVFDDIVTEDFAESFEQMYKVKNKFDSSMNLGTDNGVHRVIGTYYHHADPLITIRDKKDLDGKPLYHLRLKPATDNGEANGKPVFLSEKRLEFLKMSNLESGKFNTQQLLNPTPVGDAKLRVDFLQEIDKEFIPVDLVRFMVIDPAGDNETKHGDAWAIHVVGVEPKVDELGCSKIYVLDSYIDTLTESMAVDVITRMYLSGGQIVQVGYERLVNTTPMWLDHIVKGLRVRGRYLSEDNNSLVPLSHGGRNKVHRITSALQWALNNSCIFLSKAIAKMHRDRLKEEMIKFPAWHDDGLDALAYVYDMMSDYNFQAYTKVKPYDYKKAGLCIV